MREGNYMAGHDLARKLLATAKSDLKVLDRS